jgi:vacuolar-type H+-ATPase subunit H
VSLEEDLKAIKEAENKAESGIEQANEEAVSIKAKAKERSKVEEEKALNETREEMAAIEKALVERAQKEGEQIIKDAQDTVERLKVLAGKNKEAASDYLIEEILKS